MGQRGSLRHQWSVRKGHRQTLQKSAAVSAERIKKIEAMLNEAFAPSHLLIKDQSHLHAGHAGARDGRGHFDVTIVSPVFVGKAPLARHRMIYDALGTMMETDIHALRINAFSPDQEQTRQ